jgi:hypothetical protein
MRWVIASIGMLAACDTVFGLDGRDDIVGDAPPGVGDSNAADAMVDGPTGPHDEDHDGIIDLDDNCPGHVNADQMDVDTDGVGDACDPLIDPSAPNQRILFDAFTILGSDWIPNSVWTGDGDTVGPSMNAPTSEAFRLTHRSIKLLEGSAWSIDVGIAVPNAPETSKLVGIRPVDIGGTSLWTCAVLHDGTQWMITAGGAAVPTTTPPNILRTRGAGSASELNRCSIVAGTETSATIQPVAYPLAPQLFSFTAVRFQFIDVIQ